MIIEFPGYMRFYANFKYTLKNDLQDEDSIKQLEESSYSSFNSLCYQTMVGFIMHEFTNHFGCFTGYNPGSILLIESSEQIE